MTIPLWKARVRQALPPRKEPYWGPPLGDGRSLGYRKVDDQQARWIAKLRNHSGHREKALGHASEEFGYEQAREAALNWFHAVESGVRDDRYTVENACRDYVEDRRTERSEACAHDADKRFERTVYGTAFGRTPVAKLWSPDIKRWRGAISLSKSSQNRNMSVLRAALNLAVQNRRVSVDRRIEWETVKQHRGVDRRRTLFLDLDERRRLIECASPDAGDLIAGMALTGARPGDLINARRAQYDSRTHSVTFGAKNAYRTMPLPTAAVALFDRLARDKLPQAFLFTRADGKRWAHSDWDGLVRAAATKAGLPRGVCLYTLRHSFITQALMDGMPTLDVARISGTSLAMIERHYGHLVMNAARERLERVSLL